MRAYKGFNAELRSVLGNGHEDTCRFVPGETKSVARSKTAGCGFHCCENPFDCLGYYRLNGDNRFFLVEASGSIDEDDAERIACTEITLVKELSLLEFAGHGMTYMIEHPLRENWKKAKENLIVAAGEANAYKSGMIAIARGANPKVTGVKGAVLGLILEPEPGKIIAAKLFRVTEEMEGCRYTVDKDRNLKEV